MHCQYLYILTVLHVVSKERAAHVAAVAGERSRLRHYYYSWLQLGQEAPLAQRTAASDSHQTLSEFTFGMCANHRAGRYSNGMDNCRAAPWREIRETL
jgi:hypothetical protein